MASGGSPSTRVLSESERLDWLRLARSENVGPITFRQLLAHYGSAQAALAALPELARRGGRRGPIRIFPKPAAEAELERLAACGARLVAQGEPDYPARLAALEDAPPLITLLGQAQLLGRPGVAVVGARNASANGRRLARQLSHDLGAAGVLVVSGMARGIDAAAHEGALDSGTAAVLAGGVDVVYPEENRELYEEIVNRGAALSEMPPGTEPQARHFPRRNRLISGVSLAVVVVEATPRSGSLITARLALDQGREVFAVPGSPLDPRARGCNQLLRQGAGLVERAEDVIEALRGVLCGPLGEPEPPPGRVFGPPPAVDEDTAATARAEVESLLGASAVTIDELARQSGLAPAVLLQALLELELAGRIERQPGQKVALSMDGSEGAAGPRAGEDSAPDSAPA